MFPFPAGFRHPRGFPALSLDTTRRTLRHPRGPVQSSPRPAVRDAPGAHRPPVAAVARHPSAAVPGVPSMRILLGRGHGRPEGGSGRRFDCDCEVADDPGKGPRGPQREHPGRGQAVIELECRRPPAVQRQLLLPDPQTRATGASSVPAGTPPAGQWRAAHPARRPRRARRAVSSEQMLTVPELLAEDRFTTPSVERRRPAPAPRAQGARRASGGRGSPAFSRGAPRLVAAKSTPKSDRRSEFRELAHALAAVERCLMRPAPDAPWSPAVQSAQSVPPAGERRRARTC